MSRYRAGLRCATAFLLLGGVIPDRVTRSDDAARAELGNPVFAMNFALHTPTLTLGDQAAMLKDAGYRGMQYLGTLEDLDAALAAMDRAELEVFTAAVTPYDVPVDPGAAYPAVLKDAIRKLQGRKTLLLFQFVSSVYERSFDQGDDRAVELGRELADYARPFGVRLAVYPHVNIWCERVDHATRIVQRCQRDNLGICFNQFHWLRTDPQGDLPSLVRDTMPHLFLVTINGTTLDGGYATLDCNTAEAERFLKPFVTGRYRGPVGLQCVGIAGDPRDNLMRSMKAWQTIGEHLADAVPAEQ